MASSRWGDNGSEQSAQEKFGIRVNTSKVRPLKPESLVEVEEHSEFSQWRNEHRAIREQDLDPEPAPVPQEPRVSWWKRRIKGLFISFIGLLLVAVLFIGVVFYSPVLAVKKIEVDGAHLISQTDVEEKLQPLMGVPLTRITEEKVTQLVGHKNVLRGVSIEAKPPHDLVVQLQERIPVAVVKDGKEYVLVDEEGAQLSRVATREDAKLPLIDGGTGVLNTQEFKTMTSVLAALPSSLLSQVTTAKAQSASTITLTLSAGVQVIWGTADESELKAKVLTELMHALGDKSEVKTYDVSSPTRPTTK